jgi:hypothetical protein
VGRSLAFGETLREILSLAGQIKTPVRLLRETQAAFFVYPSPELRPLDTLDIQTPPEFAGKLHYVLKMKNFVELEGMQRHQGAESHYLPQLVKDGVPIRVCRRSARLLRPAPWDSFSESARNFSQPRILQPEPLFVLLAHDAAERRYCHSLLGLVDMHVLLEKYPPRWSEISRVAVEAGQALETYVALRLLRDILAEPVDGETLKGLEEPSACSPSRRELLVKMAGAAVSQYPAPWRLAQFIGRLLGETRSEAALPSLR